MIYFKQFLTVKLYRVLGFNAFLIKIMSKKIEPWTVVAVVSHDYYSLSKSIHYFHSLIPARL